MGESRLGRSLGLTDACARAVGGHGPGQQRAEAPAVSGRLAKVFQDTDGADRGPDADVRIQLAGSHANPRSGGRQGSFGLANIGTALE
ncbi:hypothetical protein D3C81_1948480 [compost metagenome]